MGCGPPFMHQPSLRSLEKDGWRQDRQANCQRLHIYTAVPSFSFSSVSILFSLYYVHNNIEFSLYFTCGVSWTGICSTYTCLQSACSQNHSCSQCQEPVRLPSCCSQDCRSSCNQPKTERGFYLRGFTYCCQGCQEVSEEFHGQESHSFGLCDAFSLATNAQSL